MGTQGTWNLGLSYTMTGTFPAVPAVYGKHVSVMVVAQLQSPITPGTCPTFDYPWLSLPYFGPGVELFS